MPRFSIPSIPALTLAGSAFISAAFPMARSAQAQVSPQMRGEAMTLMQICRGDYDRLCAGVQPGGGRVLASSRTMRTSSAPPAERRCHAPKRSGTARPLPARCRSNRNVAAMELLFPSPYFRGLILVTALGFMALE